MDMSSTVSILLSEPAFPQHTPCTQWLGLLRQRSLLGNKHTACLLWMYMLPPRTHPQCIESIVRCTCSFHRGQKFRRSTSTVRIRFSPTLVGKCPCDMQCMLPYQQTAVNNVVGRLWDFNSGDFQLASQKNWRLIRGYLELPWTFGVDSAALCTMPARRATLNRFD